MADGVLRILDANLNRLSEGLRTTEEYFRFILNDKEKGEALKRSRHLCLNIRMGLGIEKLIAERDTEGDVGTAVTTPLEKVRDTALSVALANLKRAQEALRVIEEYGKTLLKPEEAEIAKQLRYTLYTIEKELVLKHGVREKLEAEYLMVIDDTRGTPEEFASRIKSFADAGLGLLQLRVKNKSLKDFFLMADIAKKTLCNSKCHLIINDRADIAVSLGAFGTHQGQNDLPHKTTKNICGENMAVGASTHTAEELLEADESPFTDYAGFGPINSTKTKTDHIEPRGAALVRSLPEVSVPVFFIGGIHLEMIDDLKPPFPLRVAVSSDVLDSPNPPDRVKEYIKKLKILNSK